MVKNVRDNDGVDVARKVLDVDPVVKVRQVCLLARSVDLLADRSVLLLCLNHGR